MNFYLDLFNNREKAIIIWVLIVLVGALFHIGFRTSIFRVLGILFQKKIAVVLAAMLLYVSLLVLLFYKMRLWDVFLIKDTAFWILGVAFVLLLNADRATRDENYFKKIVLDNLKLILVLEFIVNLYVFSLWVEIILMPLLFVVIATGAVAEMKEEDISVKKVIDSILAILAVFLTIFALISILRDYQSFATIDNLRAFVLPPLLTLAYIPFLYLVALYMAYENLFVRLDIFWEKDKELVKFAKRRILILCLINLGKLHRFTKGNTQELMRLDNKNDILSMIRSFDRKE